jgi:hypothetical protein
MGVGRKMEESLSRVMPGGGMRRVEFRTKVEAAAVGVVEDDDKEEEERMSRDKRAA